VALTRKPMPSPNYSSRGGSGVRLIVIHTAEGARTIDELGNFFASPSSGVSSHVGIDDTPGVIGEYVQRTAKAWTAAGANPVAVQTELCAFAGWSADEWARHPVMLENCARWIAEEAAAFEIPIVKLTAAAAQGTGRGVCQHADLGSWGGGHWDAGGNFPIDQVLELARGGGEEEMGYPDEFWSWCQWYLTTDRKQDERPAGVPNDIPDSWWEGQKEVADIGYRYGMTDDERSWLDWYLDGKHGTRPNVPESIPDRWWDDESWALERET
jgi:hypothetical protein